MLDQFSVSRQFHETRLTLYVDCRKKWATMTIVYQRRIQSSGDVLAADWNEVRTPDLADKWLCRQVDTGRGGTASLVENIDWQHRNLIGRKAA